MIRALLTLASLLALLGCAERAAVAVAQVPQAAPATAAKIELVAPDIWVVGGRCEVKLKLTAPAEGATIPGWQFTPAGFTVDGKPLALHGELPAIVAGPNQVYETSVDLGPALKVSADFELGLGNQKALVRVLEPAPPGLDFMDEAKMPVAELEKYWVVLDTVRGLMVVEFYPALAPNHVRNYLDLSYTGFYNGTIFHRVGPGFMIQGGDPTGTGGGDGKRRLKLEATRYKRHVKGILSMARSPDPNSASCQFFIMHGANQGLDGGYSIFGNLVRGFATLDAIVRSPGQRNPDGTIRPKEQQVIVKATVVKLPPNPDDWRQGPDGKPLPKPAPDSPAK
jgi:peptidyl-prolyl cis-trans isomerase B (cyclophilin B)